MPRPDSGKAARVRELCRQLRPLIGAKAEQIHRAFLMEDDTGRSQILDYLELLAAERLYGAGDILDSPSVPVPPRPEVASGEYRLGELTYAGKQLGDFGLRENEWLAHVGIFGRSGAGKTNLGFLVVESLVKAGKPVLIFDWKRNYRDLLGKPGFEDLAVYTVGRRAAPLGFNPLIPPPGTPPKTWLKKVIAVIAHAYLLGDGVLFLLQEALDRVYTSFGVYAGSIDHWPTFRDVFQVLRDRDVSGREAGWMSSALRALSSLCFGEMDSLLNINAAPIKDLLQRPVVLELDALTQSDKVMVVQAVLLWIHHYRMAEGAREVFKHAIVIEEAHHILSNERRSLVGGQSVMELTFREIREFGESIIILDQQPSSISASALANTYATFCFNVKHRADVNAISQAMLLSDDNKNVLGRLPVGEAVVRLQGRGDGPFTIAVPPYSIHKGAVSDVAVTEQMARLGLRRHLRVPDRATDTRKVRPGPTSSDEYAERFASPNNYDGKPPEGNSIAVPDPSTHDPGAKSASQKSLEPLWRDFMEDVQLYPHSGVADRYKRLGHSVRQGQRLKQHLIESGDVFEELSITNRGRLRVIRLTDQGEHRLALNDRKEGNEDPERDSGVNAWV